MDERAMAEHAERDKRQVRDDVARWLPLAGLLTIAGWLIVGTGAALLWYPPPPASPVERLMVAVILTSVVLGGALRLLVWYWLEQEGDLRQAEARALTALGIGVAAVVGLGGMAYTSLRAVLPTPALLVLAIVGSLLAALLLRLAMQDLARVLARDHRETPNPTEAPPPSLTQRLDATELTPGGVVPTGFPQSGARVADSSGDLSLGAGHRTWPALTATIEELWSALTKSLSERRALALLLGGGLLLRLVALDSLPVSMTADEADNLQSIYRIIARREPGLFGYDWTQAPAFNLYLMAPLVWLDGLGLVGLRLTSALLSTAALLPLYLVARRVMTVGAALASVALLAGAYWYLHFSRSGWYNVDVALYALLVLWLLGRAVEEGRWRHYLLAGGALALCLYGYFAGRMVPLAVLASLPLALAVHRVAWRRIIAGYAVMLATAAMLFAPQVILGWDRLVSGRVATVAIWNAPRPYLGETELPLILLRQVERTARAFLLMDPTYSTSGLNQRYIIPGWPFLDPATAALYVVGLIVALRRWRAVWLWWPLLLVPLFATQVLSADTPDGARALIIAPLLALFAGLGLDWLVGAERWRRPVWALGVALGVAAIVGFNLAGYVRWQTSDSAIASRELAVSRAEFNAWRERQWGMIQAGQWGFNVSQWKGMRPGAEKPQPAAPPAEAPTTTAIRARQITTLAGPGRPDSQPLADPRGLAVAPGGEIYVVEAGRQGVARFARDGRLLGRWGGAGEGPVAFEEPTAVAIDQAGAIHVLDTSRGQVQVFTADGSQQSQYGANLQLFRPRGLALGDDGLIYLTDTGKNRVLRLDPSGAPRGTIPERPDSGIVLDQPTAAVGIGGVIYIGEPTRGRLYRVTLAGQPAGVAWSLAGTDTLRSARLAVGPHGELIVADVGGRRVLIVCGGDKPILAWQPAPAEVERLLDAALGADGTLYVIDAAGRLLAVALERDCSAA